ncbi:sn-glycerol-1-phosphate dehydrogenase [uncultured Victivallis sp.]|uniref:sn-glycerol-1-phosphate dehydrogenase n=1 Tax=uncultured Victivallis sp. TaxID=354118 RepID=UPI0025E2F19C|nr:sn-glycerol-1-phosphate dehydrogenase [uncultured Victivallis sp.]
MNPVPIPPGMETRLFLLENDALNQLPEAIRSLWGNDARPWLVADGNTWRAAGAEVAKILKAAGMEGPDPFLFPGTPMLHADESNVNLLLEQFPENVVPVAIGGGTVNDLVKRASGLRHVSYCCVPTAPSVDGYTSSGAALTASGLKQTLPCPAPLAVVADSGILRNAPPEMFAAGYADLMAKIPAGADWLAADTLGIEAVDPAVWELVQTPLRDNLSDPSDVRRVFTGLAATGYAMQLYRDSRPASGADHLVSHIWEMENLCCNGKPVSHGFKVAIGTVTSTALYEALFSLSEQEARRLARPGLDRAGREAEIDALLSIGTYGAATRTIALDKFREGRALAERRELIYRNWETLRKRILHQLYPLEELTRRLTTAGCPVKPADIQLGREQFLHGIRTAQLIRKRYTVLDLVYELGLLEELLQRILPVMNV